MRDYERVAMAIDNAIEVAKEEFGEKSLWLESNLGDPKVRLDSFLEEGEELERVSGLYSWFIKYQNGIDYLIVSNKHV